MMAKFLDSVEEPSIYSDLIPEKRRSEMSRRDRLTVENLSRNLGTMAHRSRRSLKIPAIKALEEPRTETATRSIGENLEKDGATEQLEKASASVRTDSRIVCRIDGQYQSRTSGLSRKALSKPRRLPAPAVSASVRYDAQIDQFPLLLCRVIVQ